jgi:hypothetical protein
MNSQLDEIRDDVWHILLHVSAYQEKSSRLGASGLTRIELVQEVVALNALAESIVMRVARLADKRRDVRSIKNYCRDHSPPEEASSLVDRFHQAAEVVVSIRNNRIGHMKAGDVSGYPVAPLPSEVLSAVGALVRLVDNLSQAVVSYSLRVGGQERLVDLRAATGGVGGFADS